MARCPKCTQSLARGADGGYPAECPNCGVRLKAKAKTPPANPVARAETVRVAASDERVVRSFSARRTAADAFHNDPFATRPGAEASDVSEPPVDAAPDILSEDSDAAAPFGSAPRTNPFNPPASTTSPTTRAAPEQANPFGGSTIAASPVRHSRTGVVKATVAGVLVATVAGVGYWFGKDAFRAPASRDRAGFHNPDRHYVFYALPAPWKPDQGRATRAGYELVLHRADLGGWITLRTEASKDEALDPKEIAEEVSAKWKDRIADFTAAPNLGKLKLAGQDAVVVEGEGTLEDKPVRGRTLVLAASGVRYYMGFEGPVDEWEKLELDFSRARENLELTGGAVTPIKTLGENDVKSFESQKFPYRVSAPAGSWREVPDLQTDSRYDDLKLQDRSRLGEVVVQPRVTKDLPGMRVRYVEAKKRLFEDKAREIENAIEKLSIRGRPALRTMLTIQSPGGDYMLDTTFVQGDGLVFQIQCRAPLDKRDVYEPIFQKIVGSFEVLDRPVAPPAPEPPATNKDSEKSKAMKAPGPETVKDAKPSAAPTKEDPRKTDSKPKETKPMEAKKPGEATKKSSDGEKKPEPGKKKKSLDDLD